MTTMPWFRFYSEILNDRKLGRICKKTNQPKAVVIGFWTCLLCLASDSPQRGTLLLSEEIPYTLEDLEDETGLAAEVITQLLSEFRSLGMVDGKDTIELINWSKRQFRSDNSTARVKKHRESKRSDETLQKRCGNVIESESDAESEQETEVEEEYNPDSPYRKLFDAFLEQSGISETLINIPKADRSINNWIKAGVGEDQVRRAVVELQDKGFAITGPWSIDNAINIVLSRDGGGARRKKKPVKYREVMVDGNLQFEEITDDES
jgi:hypothetical protein